MKTPLNDFKLDKNSGVYQNPNLKNKFGYSDGEETEQNIYNQVTKANDLSLFSRELINSIKDWPTEYHFSPLRHNLLRHYNFIQSDSILELGCGCGAITRQLGESKANVTAIDGSLMRTASASQRCRDLSNVKVYCSNFQDIEFQKKYDYVTLIGVLEYSSVYFTGNKPFNQCLEVAKSALKPNGKLIIAIENRLGLKYFIGYSEDHTGRVYDGLKDLYRKDTAHTFGKEEITDLLNQNGFVKSNFAYPFPDYKLPKLVLFEPAFETEKFSAANLINLTKARDYAFPKKNIESDYFFWRQIEKNNLVQDLANSFLIEASLSELTSKADDVFAKYYTVDRKRNYNTSTSFMKVDSEIKVIKENIEKFPSEQGEFLNQNIQVDDYQEGVILDYLIQKSIEQSDFNQFVDYIKKWIDFIISNGIAERNNSNVLFSVLKKDYLDCLPSNLIFKDNELYIIDKEWICTKNSTVSTVIYRGLNRINLKLVDKSIEGSETQINKLLNHLSLPYHDSYLITYNQVEKEIAQSVYEVSLQQENQGDSQDIPNLKKTNSNPFKNYLKRVVKTVLNR